MMPLLVGESYHFVFDGRAIPRPRRLDLARVHRCAMQVRPNQVMRDGARVREMTQDLRQLDLAREDGKRPRIAIAWRRFELGEVDRVAKHSGRRTGLEPTELQG